MAADLAGFADNYACTVVNMEMVTDICGGVYIDPCFGVGIFGKDTRNQWYAKQVQRMRQPVKRYSIKTRVSPDYFKLAFGCRVTRESSLYIGIKQPVQFGQAIKK